MVAPRVPDPIGSGAFNNTKRSHHDEKSVRSSGPVGQASDRGVHEARRPVSAADGRARRAPSDWDITRYGIGDDMYVVGRFLPADGKATSVPTVRFGSISASNCILNLHTNRLARRRAQPDAPARRMRFSHPVPAPRQGRVVRAVSTFFGDQGNTALRGVSEGVTGGPNSLDTP